MVIGYGSGGSISYSQSKVNSHYASVNEGSGIQAGSGGFDITVGGNTHLIGGVIASTADPSKNLLDTGSLTYESIHNEANYSASSIGVSAGYGSGGFSASPMLGVPQSGHSSSDTNSGIAQGTIIQRDGNTDLSGLDRNTSLDNNQALNPIFDAQKVQENMELGQVAGQVGMRAAGDIANDMAKQATTPEEQATWSDGGTNKILLHGLVGAATAALGGGDALQGALGAAASEAASKAMSDYLVSEGVDPYSPTGKSLMALASTAMGGVAGGGAGAATALQGDLYNRQLHRKESEWIKANAGKYAALHPGMTSDQAEKILAQQAYRQVQAGAAGAWDADASAFLKTVGRDMWSDRSYPGQTFLMFQADSFAQKQNATVFANPQQADADFYLRNEIVPATPEQAAAWEAMRIAATKKAAEQAAVISGTSVLGPAMSAYASGGTTFATFLAGRTGAGLIGAGADALTQGMDGKNVDPFSVGISFITGSLGAGRGFVSNVGLNAAGAATNAWMNNLFNGTNENMADAAKKAAIASAIGYGVGYGLGAGYNKISASNENIKINTPDWISIGPGMYAPTGPYPSSYILSNVGGSVSQEVSNWLLKQPTSSNEGVKK